MHIKQIIIQGFKSYKEQTVIEPFSPKCNVIVGRNGSGKSNFFAAIRFVLSDAYTQMGREERQALLHEGSGSAVMSAYVEIIFDNEDGRFPTGKDELILRRTIGLKKDEYSLDRKNATKTDVMNLLESAGFSRSNPYYIVPQGRVTTLTNMKDTERLTLLKEVAGTQVYEARRAESLKIMTETKNKRDKIDELLDYIRSRLKDLEEEKEELRGYQEKDKERRCLDYTLLHREQVKIAERLDEIEEFRQGGTDNMDESREAFIDGEEELAALKDEAKMLSNQMELLKIERRQLEEDRRESARSQAKVELEVKKLADGQSASEQARQRQKQELEAVKKEMSDKDAELAKIVPDYNKAKAEEVEVKSALDASDASRQRLLSKQGRNSQFKSKTERDKWLRKEIEVLNNTLATQKANRMDADEDVKAVQTEIKGLEKEISGLRERLEGWGGNRQALTEQVTNAKDALERLSDERKVLRREDDKLESIAENARREMNRAEQDLAHSMDGATARGLATVRRLKREQNISGAFGTVAELLQVGENYRISVEQTAGNSLFHYIVDNEATATKLAKALYDQHGGRVTFMPLSQLRPRPANFPKANDAIPMLSKIKYDAQYENAFQQVFGKTIICPNLTIAGQYARSHGLNAITTDGDTANKKGAMTGGYIDPRKSRIEAVRAAERWREEYDGHHVRATELRREIERKDQEITAAMGDLQKLEQSLRRLDDSFDPLRSELRNKDSHLDQKKDQLDSKVRGRDAVDGMLKQFGDQTEAYDAELASEFKKALTQIEESQLEELNSSVQDLRSQWNELSSARRKLENRKNLLEIDIRENLRLKLDQLNNQSADVSGSGSSHDLKEAQRELKRITKTAAAVDAKLAANETEIERSDSEAARVRREHAAKEAHQEELAKTMETVKKKMDRSISKKAELTALAAECAKNIRDLGVLPEEAFERFARMESKQVAKRLERANEALKAFKHVNKKAFEQYASFTAQRETLTKRRKELEASQGAIEELVLVLDQRKDEAIERTFKQVSREFAGVFERLVPAGRGRLVIQRKTDVNIDEEEGAGDGVENYTGVGISVSFNSKHDEQQRIQQLSGGQKSLCALALVFAIQQCDPAPFYLFDEIDANLDAQYRTAVAQMLADVSAQQSQAAAGSGADDERVMSGQFICTTFRPEMVLVADKTYGVMFGANKTSKVEAVSREKALEFVEGQKP
ncbi:Structural maintenance of chromosomes protein 3 [Pseudogymnoascus australis]